MLLRFDPFRDIDRVAEQFDRAWSRTTTTMPMDAVRSEHEVTISFDLPGVAAEDIDLTVERDVLTVTASRRFTRDENDEVLASERPQGTVSRRVLLGETLDTEKLEATYDQGVLTVKLPVAEQAKPRKVHIEASGQKTAIDAPSSEVA